MARRRRRQATGESVSFSTLALDLATVTGWAVHSTGMDRPFFGTLPLGGVAQEVGPPALKLWGFLNDQHRLHQFSHIAFEAQHVSERMSMDTVYKLIALGGVTEMFAAAAGVKVYKVHIGEWRKHFLGKGGGMKRAEAKQRCLSECEKFGWHTLEEDAAEACGILDYFLSMLPGEQRPWRDDAFMKGTHR